MIDMYIQYGVDSDLANKLSSIGIPKTTLEKTSNKNLKDKYGLTYEEIKNVKSLITRQLIDKDIITKLLESSNYTCCICKGTKSSSYIIHHIEEYSISQNNSYHNLAVLCPADHDLAHKKGKSLTLTLTEEQIKMAKHKWEKQVLEINVQKASKNGNINEIDFLNILRIEELYTELFKKHITSKYTSQLVNQNLLTDNGLINEKEMKEVNDNPATPLIFFASHGSTILKFHYYEGFKEILNYLPFKDLDTLLNRTAMKKGLEGEYCFYVGGLYSSRLPENITLDTEPMKFHLKKRKIIVEWLVDPQYFCSNSAKCRTIYRNTYIIYGRIRSVNILEIEGVNKMIIDIRTYCFGLPELAKDRKPTIAFRDQVDELFCGEED